MEGFKVPGTAQEYLVLPENRIVKLPVDMTFEQGAMIEPAALGAHSTSRAAELKNKNVLVLGAGRIDEVGTIARKHGDSCLLVTTSSTDALASIL